MDSTFTQKPNMENIIGNLGELFQAILQALSKNQEVILESGAESINQGLHTFAQKLKPHVATIVNDVGQSLPPRESNIYSLVNSMLGDPGNNLFKKIRNKAISWIGSRGIKMASSFLSSKIENISDSNMPNQRALTSSSLERIFENLLFSLSRIIN